MFYLLYQIFSALISKWFSQPENKSLNSHPRSYSSFQENITNYNSNQTGQNYLSQYQLINWLMGVKHINLDTEHKVMLNIQKQFLRLCPLWCNHYFIHDTYMYNIPMYMYDVKIIAKNKSHVLWHMIQNLSSLILYTPVWLILSDTAN